MECRVCYHQYDFCAPMHPHVFQSLVDLCSMRIGHGQVLEEEVKKSLWELIVAQFEDLLVRILLASALVRRMLGKREPTGPPSSVIQTVS